MANTLQNGGFWLPSEILTGDDILMDKENLNKNGFNTAFEANCGFPTGFPHHFCSYGSSSVHSSPVESVVSSTETESDEDLLAGVTRHFARSTLQERNQKIAFARQNLESRVLSGSPQSTLNVAGSWSCRGTVYSHGSSNGPSPVPLPPTTPLSANDSWDLIFAAAGQVARLKMSGEGPPKGRGVLGPTRCLTPVQHPSPPMKSSNDGFYANHCLPHNLSQTILFEHARQDQVLKQQCSSVWERPTGEGLFSNKSQFQQQLLPQNRGRVLGRSGSDGNARYAWPPLQVQHQNHQNLQPQQGGSGMRAIFLGGSGVKRECAGTGVFLPRRYSNPSESRKKPGCSTALLPARVVQALNKNLDGITSQARFSGSFISDHDTLMARRNALLAQQKRSLRPEGAVVVNHELCLPQEWTY